MYGYRGSQMLAAACELGIPDLLADGPKTAPQIAAATSTHGQTVRSLMRGLCAWEVFTENPDGSYAATEISEHFRSDRPGLRNQTLMLTGRGYQAWGNIMQTLRTGENAYIHTFGKTMWEMGAEDPAQGARFNAAMVAMTAR